MFTIKYRTYELAPTQNADQSAPRNYNEHEQIHGPFALVSKEMDENGYPVVYAHRDEAALGMTFGPHRIQGLEDQVAGRVASPRPTLWVMNEAGATVAKYDL